MPNPTIPKLIRKYQQQRDIVKSNIEHNHYLAIRAILKGRLSDYDSFLADLRSLPEPGLKWVKASEIAADTLFHCRYDCPERGMLKGTASLVQGGKFSKDFIRTSWGGFFKPSDYHLLEILDESPSPVDAVEAVDPVAFVHWCFENGWIRTLDKLYFYKAGDGVFQNAWKSPAALLDLYKQSLTNTK